ncbi:MAG: hypothetical protein NZ552_00955 [Planctomycetes bacterium]|nr:hypothetical protein [Planctomycetota bacterium]
MSSTDSIPWTCSACGLHTTQPAALLGRAIYCPRCHTPQVLKRAETDRVEAQRIATTSISRAESGTGRQAQSATSSFLAFACGACGHRAQIPAHLSGHPVRCPQCGTVQLAGMGPLRSVRLDEKGRIPFTCTVCGGSVRLAADYAGKAIRCPKCQAAQVVPQIQRDSVRLQEPSAATVPLPNDLVPLDAITPLGVPTLPAAAGAPAAGAPSPATASVAKPPSARIGAQPPRPAAAPPAKPVIPTPPPAAAPPTVAAPLASPARPASAPPAAPAAQPQPSAAPAAPSPAAASAPPAPSVGADDELDLDAPEKPKSVGSVVRRSGRLELPGSADSADEQPSEPPKASKRSGSTTVRRSSPLPTNVGRRLEQPTAADGAATAPRSWLLPVLLTLTTVCVLAVVLLVVLYHIASAQNETLARQLAEARRRQEALGQELAELRRQLDAAQAELSQAKAQLEARRSELEQRERELASLRAELERWKPAKAGESTAQAPTSKP